MPMTRNEIERLLKKPNIAVVSVTTPDGGPHSVPVWYEYRGGTISIFCAPDSFKYKCLQRNPRISLCVDTRTPPYRCVILKGTAKTAAKKAAALIERMAVAYYGAREGKKYAATIRNETLGIISFKPTRMISWDYSRDLA